MNPEHDTVLVVDFGAQYAQLIARRVRECNVYSEIVPHTITADELVARRPAGVIFSGGPASVHVEGAPATWTDFGPPLRITPTGRRSAISAAVIVWGTISL